jgi:hypothetical protein
VYGLYACVGRRSPQGTGCGVLRDAWDGESERDASSERRRGARCASASPPLALSRLLSPPLAFSRLLVSSLSRVHQTRFLWWLRELVGEGRAGRGGAGWGGVGGFRPVQGPHPVRLTLLDSDGRQVRDARTHASLPPTPSLFSHQLSHSHSHIHSLLLCMRAHACERASEWGGGRGRQVGELLTWFLAVPPEVTHTCTIHVYKW